MEKNNLEQPRKDLSYMIANYTDKNQNDVKLTYFCAHDQRKNIGSVVNEQRLSNSVDRGRLSIFVNDSELYRISFVGAYTNERESALKKVIDPTVKNEEPAEVLWGNILNQLVKCCGACYIK